MQLPRAELLNFVQNPSANPQAFAQWFLHIQF